MNSLQFLVIIVFDFDRMIGFTILLGVKQMPAITGWNKNIAYAGGCWQVPLW